jgi:hypothetical protein
MTKQLKLERADMECLIFWRPSEQFQNRGGFTAQAKEEVNSKWSHRLLIVFLGPHSIEHTINEP